MRAGEVGVNVETRLLQLTPVVPEQSERLSSMAAAPPLPARKVVAERNVFSRKSPSVSLDRPIAD